MKFSVTNVEVLDSKAGPGLKIGDKILGCARIVGINMEEGKTLEDYALEGMSVGYKSVPEQADRDTNNVVLTMRLNDTGLDVEHANNYVLIIQQPSEDKNAEPGAMDTLVVHDTKDLVDLFILPEEDAASLDKYIGMLADSRQLELVRYTDLNENSEAIMFVNKFDREVVEAILDDDFSGAYDTYARMATGNPEYYSELSSHNFIKLLVMSVIQTGQDRYNKLNRDDILAELAGQFSKISYWKDGERCVPSVKDVEEYMDTIKEQIRIR